MSGLIGGIIGAAVGSFVPGGAKIGWMVGALAGGLIGGSDKRYGPRLADLQIQSSDYGKPIPIIYANGAVGPCVIWLAGNKIREVEVDSDGKGGPTIVEFEYFANFAVLVGEGEHTIGHIWSGAEKREIFNGIDFPVGWDLRIYPGTETQPVDPAMEMDKGVGRAPAYRGYCIIVFENYPLKQDGNALPQLLVEIASVGHSKPAVFNEYPYPRTKLNGVEVDLGTWPISMGGCAVYIPSLNEWWAGVFQNFNNYDTWLGARDIPTFQIMDGTTLVVKEYVPNQPTGPYWNDNYASMPTQNGIWYDSFVNQVMVLGTDWSLSYPASNRRNRLYRYDATTRAYLGSTVLADYSDTINNYIVVKQYLDEYTGELWLQTFYPNSNRIYDFPSLVRISKSTWVPIPAQSFKLNFNGKIQGAQTGTANFVQLQNLVFTQSGRVFAIAAHAASATVKNGWCLFEFNRLTGVMTQVAVIPSGDSPVIALRFFDMFYVEATNKLHLFCGLDANIGGLDNATLESYPEAMYEFWLDDNSFHRVFTLTDPENKNDLWFWGYDPGLLPVVRYDQYRKLFWLWDWHMTPVTPFVPLTQPNKTIHIAGFSITDGSLKYAFPIDSQLTNFTYYYSNVAWQSGMVAIRENAVYGIGYILTSNFPEDEFGNPAGEYKYWNDNEALLEWTFPVVAPPPLSIPLWKVITDLSIRAGLTVDQLDLLTLIDLVDGYQVGRQNNVRNCIESLRPIYYFDLIESSGKIKGVKRGSLLPIVIPDAALATHRPTDERPDLLVSVRAASDQLPRRVNVRYMLQNRQYDYEMKFAMRQGVARTNSNQEQTIDSSVVLTDTKAQQAAVVNLYEQWLYRMTYSLFLPKSYSWVEPTDVIKPLGIPMRVTKTERVEASLISVMAVDEDALTGLEDQGLYNPYVIVTETPPPFDSRITTPKSPPPPSLIVGGGGPVVTTSPSFMVLWWDGVNVYGNNISVSPCVAEERSESHFYIAFTDDNLKLPLFTAGNKDAFIAEALASTPICFGVSNDGNLIALPNNSMYEQDILLASGACGGDWGYGDGSQLGGGQAHWMWLMPENTVIPIPIGSFQLVLGWPHFTPAFIDELKAYNRIIYGLWSMASTDQPYVIWDPADPTNFA